jgi:hypothetical protein
MKSSTPIKLWSLDNDKDYFARLRREVKDNRQQSSIVFIGLMCLFTVILLYVEAKVIDVKVFSASFIVVSVLMMAMLLSMRRHRKPKVKKVIQHALKPFEPVSLGILYFGFALSLLLINQQINDLLVLIVAIFISLLSLAFFFAVFSRSVRGFINTRAALIVMPLTFFAFVLGWLAALSQVSGVIRAVVIYFGFAWVVAMLAILFRDVKNELARILFVIFFLFVAVIKFCEYDTIGIIGGIFLTGIAVLLYLVATGRLHPYGEVLE